MKKALYLLVISGFLLSPLRALSSSQGLSNFSPSVQNNSSSSIISTQAIVVSVVVSLVQVAVTAAQPVLQSCAISGEAGATLVQDQAEVNLNQPAQCFQLSPGQLSVQSSLAVAQLAPDSIQVKVIKTNPVNFELAGNSSSTDQPLPALPQPLPFGAALVFGVIAASIKKSRAKQLSVEFTNQVTLSKLVMLRC